MNLDSDSKVIFKEKQEEKEIKAEGTTKNATIRFDFWALTLAPPAMAEERAGDTRRAEHQKFQRDSSPDSCCPSGD